MNLRGITLNLFFAVLLVTPAFARKTTDVIVMKNGDRMTCEIKALSDGVLSVSLDYVDGTIFVQWAKVAKIESAQKFIVTTQDGTVHSGTIVSAEGEPAEPMKIEIAETGAEKTVVDASQVVGMSETSENILQRFNGAIDFGINYSKGNQATQYSFGAQTGYTRERWAAQSSFNSNLSSNNGSTVSTRQQFSLSGYRLMPWDNYFYQGLGSFLQSSVQGISLQTSLGGGIGRFLKNTGATTISIAGGLAWQNTEYSISSPSAGTQNATAALIAAQLKVHKFKKTTLNITSALLPVLSEPGRVRLSTNASYYLKLISNLSWTASFYGNWDNRPPLHLSGSDYGSSSGLRWTFGNP